jgi:hypothetical protein
MMMIRTYTDYPITELGDTEGEIAPIRECRVISYDNNKYCEVSVCGVVKSIKSGYIYFKPGRSQEVPSICRSWFLWWKGLFQ